MAARRAPRRGGRGFRPATFWDGRVPTGSVAVPAASKLLVASFTNAGDQELTIRRTRGLVATHTDRSVASEIQLGAFGIGVFTNTAIAAGIASLPDPVTDVEDEIWFVYGHISSQFKFGSDIAFDAQNATLWEFDSKAMRKVPQGYAIAFIIANSHATTGFNATVAFRFLSSVTGR